MEWQPIETAPKDGSQFIGGLYVRCWNHARDTARLEWEQHVISYNNDEEMDCGWSFNDFTHWMPLPPPPTS